MSTRCYDEDDGDDEMCLLDELWYTCFKWINFFCKWKMINIILAILLLLVVRLIFFCWTIIIDHYSSSHMYIHIYIYIYIYLSVYTN